MTFLETLPRVEAEAETLFSRDEVETAIRRVAGEVTDRLAACNPIVLTVLNGGIIFCGLLLPELGFPLELDAISVGRYRGQTRGAELQWRLKPSIPLAGRAVLLVDDVLDEGVTLAAVQRFCRSEGAEEVLTAVLVEKKLGHEKPCSADFVGLEADDRYLFGYGMDYRNYLRNAPGIYACGNTEESR